MADKKISQLTSGSPAQAADEYVVARSGANYKLTLTNIAASMPPIGATTPNTASFTTLTTSSTVTLNGGTANGVLYLNGSKVATSGSALVFDGTNLGLGVTPSAWNGYKAFQIGAGSSLAGWATDAGTDLSANAFYQTGWKYIATAAAARYQITSTAEHRWHTAASGTAGNAITFTQAMTLDASGNLGIGTTSPTNTAGYTTLQIQGSTGGIVRLNNSGNTIQCYAGSDTVGGFIGSSTNHPFVFYTNSAERARITAGGGFQCVNALSVGNATPTTSGAGVTFPATQSASSNANTLDDYEEGTWTPTVTSTAGTYAGQSGRYTKIGNLVTVDFWVQNATTFTYASATAAWTITGLPFAPSSFSYSGPTGSMWSQSFNFNNTESASVDFVVPTATSSSSILFRTSGSAAVSGYVKNDNNSGFIVTGQVAYTV
jgi:hypothetical protein